MQAGAAESVFLNVPYDSAYEKQFLALIASTIALGRTPRCVLEVAEGGLGRLSRLVNIIAQCEVSVHDLSRVGLPARFNMPFELGLACAIAEVQPPHVFVLLEKVPYRIQRTLSDVNGRDPYIHGGTIRGTIRCILDALRTARRGPSVQDVFSLYRNLAVVSTAVKRSSGTKTLFTRSNFLDVVEAGVELAERSALIQP